MAEAAITQEGLAAALKRRNYTTDYATEIFDDVMAHREPEWKAGDVVRDNEGKVYMRVSGNCWIVTAPSTNSTTP